MPKGIKNFNYRHGYAVNGIHPIYSRWDRMIRRCHDKKCSDYKYYGARGITVCSSWRKSIKNFVKDMGLPSSTMTLERVNNNKGYSKSNCKWATRKEQRSNQRPSKKTQYLTFNGERRTLAEWAERTGIKYITLYARIKYYNYSAKKALEK